MKNTALIMAGGKGERFWPKSRQKLPKQFLDIIGEGDTMIQMTVKRILPLVNMEDIYIATNKDYKDLVKEQLPDIPDENILCEPVGRNTAPCIGLGAVHIAKKYGDAVMMVLPSDHLIQNQKMFVACLQDAVEVAEKECNLVTIGITPNYPETGYGYIKFNMNKKIGNVYTVDSFKEKPSLEVAQEYLESGNYLWNSGMFIWKVSSILQNMQQLMPITYDGLKIIQDAIGKEEEIEVLEKIFAGFDSQSVDYGIMEKADNIYIVPSTFLWDDVGSWNAIGRLRDKDENGNTISGNVITVETKNCIVEGGRKLITTVGLENLIVIDTEDAILICDNKATEGIKKILEELKNNNQIDYI